MMHPVLKRNMSSLIGQKVILYTQCSAADTNHRECNSRCRGFEQLLPARGEWERLHLRQPETLPTLSGKSLYFSMLCSITCKLLLLQEEAFVNATLEQSALKQLDGSILRKYVIDFKSFDFHFKMIPLHNGIEVMQLCSIIETEMVHNAQSRLYGFPRMSLIFSRRINLLRPLSHQQTEPPALRFSTKKKKKKI